MVCTTEFEHGTVLYRVEVTGATLIKIEPTQPIIDTDQAEDLVESNEPGSNADCRPTHIRQIDAGSTFACETPSSTLDFKSTAEGNRPVRRIALLRHVGGAAYRRSGRHRACG